MAYYRDNFKCWFALIWKLQFISPTTLFTRDGWTYALLGRVSLLCYTGSNLWSRRLLWDKLCFPQVHMRSPRALACDCENRAFKEIRRGDSGAGLYRGSSV